MNPLNHFGIKTRMIRGDTKSYNDRKAYREKLADQVNDFDRYIDMIHPAPLDNIEKARYDELRRKVAVQDARDARHAR